MSTESQFLELQDENLKSGEETADFTTDDECTGQRARCQTKAKLEEVDVNVQKIISKKKSESMFELRKLRHQQHPVTTFNKKSSFEIFFSSRKLPLISESTNAATAGGTECPSPSLPAQEPVTLENSQSVSPSPEPVAESLDAQEPTGNVSDRVQQFNPQAEPTPQSLMPDDIRLDMQNLLERQIVHEVLQGPAEDIDRALREGMEERRARRRPRPRPRPRPHASPEEDGDDGGDEMGRANVRPVGRLMSRSNRRGRSHNRHVQFAPALPVPNADGRYPVPRRDQSIIVDRLRQSPALNSLGDEARDEIVAEVSGLVSQQLVTSALSGEFRGVLELHVQSRAQQIQTGRPRPAFAMPARRLDDEDSDDREALPSAHVRELREEMMTIRGQLNELKQMMKLSFDLQLDIQRSIRQEVAAALSCALLQENQQEHSANRTIGPGRAKAVDSGRCVICSEGVIDAVIYHCGHMATCIACGLEMKNKALKCPICRAPITDVIRAYTSML